MERNQGLSPKAYKPLPDGESYDPYVPADKSPPEFTGKALAFGIFFGILFGGANAYLGLRAGLTISTSIPVAVMTVAAFRVLAEMGVKRGILEANLSQTIGSASSSLASGIIFTLPALFMWELDPSLGQMTFLAMCGGCLGILFMIPLRRFLIRREHGHLPYPEGTACAEVLVASEVGGGRAANVFWGLGIGALFKLVFGWIKLLPDSLNVAIPFIPRARISSEMSAALFGVGYILGPRISMIMVGGGLLSSMVIIPAIAIWGAGRGTPLYPEVQKLIADMSAGEIWNRYVRYIGAGAVATGGLITLVRSVPMMLESFRVGAKELKSRLGGAAAAVQRTSADLPLWMVGAGAGVIALTMALLPHVFGERIESFFIRLAGALLIVVFAFFFVTVSSRIVGLVGVTSNPTSGMTIATLLGTSSLFFLFGWTDQVGQAAAITVGCVVAIAASIAGDTSQDLKTGFLMGATPRRQQTGELIGVLTSAVFVSMAVILLGETFEFGSSEIPAPQATLMKLVVEGVLQSALPWGLVGIGAGIAILCELARIPSLPFAVGLYLPLSTTFPLFLGGLLRLALERRASDDQDKDDRREKGILFGSGLVGGEGLMGIGIAAVAFIQQRRPAGIGEEWAGPFGFWLSLAVFLLLIYFFRRRCLKA